MAIVEVHDSERKKRRELLDSLGDDILRYIAELVTNCDDSYNREEEHGNMPIDDPKVIYIELCEDGRGKNGGDMIVVTDNAEGMSLKTLEEKFKTYDEDKAGDDNAHVRGLYGRGASDVLRAASSEKKTALITTIKDGHVNVLKYITSDSLKYSFDIEEKNIRSSQMEGFRQSNRIPVNGTRVAFGIPSIIKFNKNIKKKLKDSIETYPMFRYLLNTPNRKVVFIENGIETVLSSKPYSFESMEYLTEREFTYHFNEYDLDCVLKIYRNENKQIDGTQILVVDEKKAVYDNTMFNFSTNVSAKNISGELVIKGLRGVCHDYLNNKDIAIFRVNRTGFDIKNPFYTSLNAIISPMIDEILREYGSKTKSTDITNNKKFSDALKRLNKYIANELKDTISGGNLGGQEPPTEGIKFVRTHASITCGKTYDLKLLINSALIGPSDTINISVDENDNIDVSPSDINYLMEDIKDNGLVVKDVVIHGKSVTNAPVAIEANCNNYKTIILIEVIEQDIHDPINGFEFFPKELVLTPDEVHKANLYYDKNIVPIGSIIKFEVEGLELSETEHTTNESELLDENIGCIVVKSKGGIVGSDYLVTAKVQDVFNDLSTSVKVTIVEAGKNKNTGGGLISKITLEANEDLFFQAYYHPHTHAIVINTKNPVNVALMGSMEDKDPNNPKFSKDQRRYLCDLIAQQAAQILVDSGPVKNGDIALDEEHPEEAFEEYRGLIQQHKNKMFADIYSALVESGE